jgi:hypothetical protein
MSSDDVAVVRGIYEAFGRGDVDAVFAAMEPDIEWDEAEGMPYGGVHRGRDAIVENVLDEDRVLARGRYGGRGAQGELDAKFVHLWTLAGSRVTRYEQLADTRRFCDAVGR